MVKTTKSALATAGTWRALLHNFKFQRVEDTAGTKLYKHSLTFNRSSKTSFAKSDVLIHYKVVAPEPNLLPVIAQLGDFHRRRLSHFVKDADLALTTLATVLNVRHAELSLVLCDASYMRYMNGLWRGVDSSTDVLAFEYLTTEEELVGDVVISLEATKAQASRFRHSVRDEFRVLLLHGLLHLVGYDHEKGKSAAEDMRRAEQTLAQALGWNRQSLLLSRSSVKIN